ncbi:hypothetical protein E2553_29305 [Paraburkholderia dipogonis]|uniref:DUF2946 domain-containing protein n=1 Tax=Paraburkholderia dipogonis TaxID=1211383 RepID=A0A4Y8MTM1_9BURK|nr:hypothetical protein [Paraburkholderia dipogonis]TFE40811.1 hypothetical protein E2553_29305 [Paraburkholderia dipogonis]
MLDFVPMSYWRKLFIVVLLVLSLPVQSFAAVSMKCGSSHSVGAAPAAHEEAARAMAHHHDHAAMMANSAGNDTSAHLRHDSPAGGEHHAHACSTCASCCFGGALPVSPLASLSANAAHFAVPLPPAVRVASFLTGGVERPPRITLV